MIKLFLITLLCVAVFAQSTPDNDKSRYHDISELRVRFIEGLKKMLEHVMNPGLQQSQTALNPIPTYEQDQEQ